MERAVIVDISGVDFLASLDLRSLVVAAEATSGSADVNVPPAARFLTGHAVEFADRRGWPELLGADLLA